MQPVRIVTLAVTAVYVGDYYGLDELVDVTAEWIGGALEDRDNLVRSQISGHVVEVTLGQGDQ